MPKAPDPMRKKAMELFLEKQGKIGNREIANVLGINEKSVGSWKSKDNWNGVLRKMNGENTEYSEKGKVKKGQTDNKEGRYKKSRKGIGNPNPVTKFTTRNSAGVKHGMFRKYLPEGMQDIVDEIESSTVLDHLWSQITITFANILRSQEIIWVEDRYDIDKESIRTQQLIDENGDPSGVEKEYTIKFAYERQEALIKAQTRAMAEYRNLVKQYMILAGEDDERALKLKVMQADLDIKSATVKALNKENEAKDINVVIVDEWRTS